MYAKMQGKKPRDPKELTYRTVDDLKRFISMIKNGQNFTLVKYGDGEWGTVTSQHEYWTNCDGNHYFRGLGDQLIDAYIWFLQDPKTYICQWHDILYEAQEAMERDYYKSTNRDKFIFYDILIQRIPFIPEQIQFFKEVKASNRKKIYVSNQHMIFALLPFLNIDVGIVIPTIDCYLHQNEIVERIVKAANDNAIVLFSAGMAAKSIIHKVAMQKPNVTLVDIGSTFDALVKRSRDYNADPAFRQLLIDQYLKNEN